jgi:hypothetical protein
MLANGAGSPGLPSPANIPETSREASLAPYCSERAPYRVRFLTSHATAESTRLSTTQVVMGK